MKNFNKLNLITGWIIFAVATIVYLLTMEPTASFWDCGEFISTAMKQEVGHPPGAPVFMILGRLFTLFAGGDVSKIAVWMNAMSALASGFTILFLFWTITHLAKKMVIQDEDYSTGKIISVIGAGIVGALAYTFSDTFWFSAVEAEVYATSSLFTAFVFWAILKWENIADEPHANRWLILIAFLMGLSIGVHLLNLLAIPAIVFVYYFKKYTPTTAGIIASLGISVAILGAMMYIIIPGFVSVGTVFELMFVNGFGLPYHSGFIFYAVALFALLAFLIYLSHKKGQVIWNTIIVSFTVVAIGYSSYAIIIIRSEANTPLNESAPDTAFDLLRYLNREQYGQTPLFYGIYFNSPPIKVIDAKPMYYRENGKYVKVKQKDYEYDPNFKGFFPRMYSERADHVEQYLYWAKMNKGDLYQPQVDAKGNPVRDRNGEVAFDLQSPLKIPTFSQNLRFFIKYQVGFMYMRYFMWNFAGRQNDLQGSGELTKGNWISGIKIIDEARLGPQDNVPDYLKNNKGRNRYFLLPLLLGIAGMIFQYQRKNKDFWVVTLLFVLTGFAILVYLNQYPLQPRERDYAYAGSFYAFTIWIGLGVLWLIQLISKNYKSVVAAGGVTLLATILVPGIMAAENWDDHDRSQRYTARDFAYNYLNSCEKNAVLFTNGDNDTFPLWYIQEVEGVRTDLRVINLSYFTADWYISQMQKQVYDSKPVKFGLTEKQYRQGTRDYAVFVDDAMIMLDEKYNANKAAFQPEYEAIFTSFLAIVKDSKVPELAAKDYDEIKKGYANFTPEKMFEIIGAIERNKVFEVNAAAMSDVKKRAESLLKRIDQTYLPFSDAMRFLKSEDPRFQRGQYFIPARKFVMYADTAKLRRDGIIKGELLKTMVPEIRWDIGKRNISKNGIMTMDLIESNNWERPVYFAITASRDNYLNLDKYIQREGLAYRLLPATGKDNDLFSGSVNTEVMYPNLMEKFRWGGIDNPEVYLDENNMRMISNFRYSFASLANALSEEGDSQKAHKVLDRCMELTPDERVPYNMSVIPIIQTYFTLKDTTAASKILNVYLNTIEQEMTYFKDLQLFSPSTFPLIANDFQMNMSALYNLYSLSNTFQQKETADRIIQIMQRYDGGMQGFQR
jgi:L-rhamnose mutarotase